MARSLDQSRALQKRAEKLIPGGVNSPVRAFRSVGSEPPFLVRGLGAHVWDADGNRYIDYVGSWGPLILGHSNPEVIEAIIQAARNGTSFGASTPSEAQLAELVIEAFPAIEKVRFVSSGTEATMSAIRLARAATGRKFIVKFEGCYHGHSDALLVKAGSGVATLGIPGSAGVPEEFVEFTLALPYNNPSAVEAAFSKFKGQIACVIVEPVVGNMGCVRPQPGYLKALRDITARDGALLLFDEVMTGFQVCRSAEPRNLYGIQPDLTTLGKIIGGGLPVGAYGGSAKLMNMIAPLGPVYQAGTLSGNPLAMAGRDRVTPGPAESEPAAVLCAARLDVGQAGRWHSGGSKRGWCGDDRQSRGFDVHLLFYRRASHQLGERGDLRYREVRTLPRRAARCRSGGCRRLNLRRLSSASPTAMPISAVRLPLLEKHWRWCERIFGHRLSP